MNREQIMSRFRFRDRLSGSGALLGLLQMGPNPLLVEMTKDCGYDFLLLDGEHGTFNEAEFSQALTALAATDVLAMVRLAGHDLDAMKRYQRMGADVVVVPHVSTQEEACRMAQAAIQAKISIIAIIESALGASNAEAILAVDGLAGVLVGPNDLSADLGYEGNYTSAAYTQALERTEHAATRAGKVLGTVPHGKYSLPTLYGRGHRLFILGTDRSLLREAMSAQVAQARRDLHS